MLREMQTTTKLIRLRKNKSSLGELSLEMALPFKRKNALLNQQHLWEEIFCGFQNTKLKPIGKKRKREKKKRSRKVAFAYKIRMSLSSANCKLRSRKTKKRGWEEKK